NYHGPPPLATTAALGVSGNREADRLFDRLGLPIVVRQYPRRFTLDDGLSRVAGAVVVLVLITARLAQRSTEKRDDYSTFQRSWLQRRPPCKETDPSTRHRLSACRTANHRKW